MFTGLVTQGKIVSVQTNQEGRELSIEAAELVSEIKLGDSIAINGACQTAVDITGNIFKVQAVHVTLEKTTLSKLKVGDQVNLELALRLSDRLGGHLVQGHVNGMGQLVSVMPTGKNYLVTVKIPSQFMKYMIEEGSISLDGISLTIAKLDRSLEEVTVSIIPHTWEETNLKNKKIGDLFNIEADVLAKYVENLLQYGKGNTSRNETTSNISESWLREQGF